jgi:hypothetical protein
MASQNVVFNKGQLVRKYFATIKDLENKKVIEEKNNIEKIDKYKYFCDKICDIILNSDNIYKEFMDSDSLKKIKNSDKIYLEMKKYINSIELEELNSFLDKMDNFEFNEEIQKVIKSETKLNLKNYLNEMKIYKKSNALKRMGEIKIKFESAFPNLNFDIMEFEKKIDEKIKDFTFKEDEINEINEIVGKIMIDKFKELINNELFYLINNINILN